MKIDFTISIGDFLTFAGFLIGIFLTIWQLRVSNKQNRGQIILGLLDKHLADEDTVKMLYQLEYGKFIFNPVTFPLSPEEKTLDKILFIFDQIAKLYELGILKKPDLILVEYDYLRVFTNNEVQKYFQFLDITPNGYSTNSSDFNSYRKLALSLKAEQI